MHTRRAMWRLLRGSIALALMALGLLLPAEAAAPRPQAAAQRPSGAQDATPTPAGRRLIRPTLAPDATQADYGYEVYRLVCKACHGDKGQGLTPDWIAQWAPEDQNCWQSKCHNVNHPPDGFVVPRDVPPVVGPRVTSVFPDARALHDYIVATMPWQEPASLQPDEYWQVTAYLLRLNGVEAGREPLDAERAVALKLRPAASESQTASPEATPTPPFSMPPAVPIQDGGHGLIMPDFGPDATHLDYGEEVYRLVCKACHGDKGQGLTPDWIAQWAPEDQNCWQTKCHAANHPPEGFILPTYVPPIAGPQFIARWQNGRQLHDYIRTAMPWHAPGTLEDDEYWQATAWVLALNGVDVGRDPLDNTRAEVLRLSAAQPQAAEQPQATMPANATMRPEATPIPGIYATRQADIAAEKAIEAASQHGFPWGWVALMVFSVAGLTWIIAQFLRRSS